MKNNNQLEMSYEHAAKIANDLLDVVQILFKLQHPILLCDSSKTGKTIVTTFKLLQDGVTVEIAIQNANKMCCIDRMYKLVQNNRYFEITFFSDPDDMGYCSMLPDFNSSTYVLCYIQEKRENGDLKHEMSFGLDIEKGTFLELFELIHYNVDNIVRRYPEVYNSPLENELKDSVILL